MAYSQNDLQWKNVKIGFDTGPSDTIGNYGCYMTAIANVCKWAGNDLTPLQINNLCKQNGWLVAMDAIARDDIPALLCSNLQYVGRTNWTDAVSMNFFDDASDPNIAYIVKLDASHAPGLQSHFVMVWKTLGNGDLEIEDSWDGVRKPLSHYGNPSVILYSAMKFVKTSPPPPSPPLAAIPEPPPPPVITPPLPPSPTTITPPITASNTEQYSLVTAVPYYPSPGNAFNRTNSNGNLTNGAYYVFNQQQGMYSLTKTLGQSQGTWVNPADNVVAPPKPVVTNDTTADIQKSWKWFFANHEPVEYKMLQDLVVRDVVHGGPSIQVHKGRTIDIYGSFEKDDKIYLRPFTASDLQTRYHFYGIPTTDIYSGAPYMDNEFNVIDNISARWESFYDKAIKTIEGIFRPLKRKK